MFSDRQAHSRHSAGHITLDSKHPPGMEEPPITARTIKYQVGGENFYQVLRNCGGNSQSDS